MLVVHLLLTLAAGLGLASAQPLDKRASDRTSPPAGCTVVRMNETQPGEHATVGAAITALGETSTAAACIFIYPGIYREQLVIDYKGPLTVYGYTLDGSSYTNNTVYIAHNQSVSDNVSDEASAAAVNVRTASFSLYNVIVWNTYMGDEVAPALVAAGNKQAYYGVTLLGHRATLNARAGDQYYSNSYIEGSLDYVYGGASAWFEKTAITSNAGGVMTASTRATDDDPSWFVLNDCQVVALTYDPSIEPKSVYLGSTLGDAARVMIQDSNLSGVINPVGWLSTDSATPKFYEFKNRGDGNNTSKREHLSPSTAAVTREEIWPKSGTDWIDKSY